MLRFSGRQLLLMATLVLVLSGVALWIARAYATRAFARSGREYVAMAESKGLRQFPTKGIVTFAVTPAEAKRLRQSDRGVLLIPIVLVALAILLWVALISASCLWVWFRLHPVAN
jgi:hypothetical protein